MAKYDYEIGTTSSTTNVEGLATPINPPRGSYKEWSIEQIRGDGSIASHGFPQVEWVFSWLNQAMIDQLRTFCPGSSAVVYIVTRINTGTFVKYSCIMHWPSDQLSQRDSGDIYTDLTLSFTRLETA